VKIMPLARGDFALTSSKKQEKLPLVLAPLVGIEAEHHGRRPTPLSDDQGLLPASDTQQDGGGVLPKVSDRNDFWELCHLRIS
jgi:hypothetical protein